MSLTLTVDSKGLATNIAVGLCDHHKSTNFHQIKKKKTTKIQNLRAMAGGNFTKGLNTNLRTLHRLIVKSHKILSLSKPIIL